MELGGSLLIKLIFSRVCPDADPPTRWAVGANLKTPREERKDRPDISKHKGRGGEGWDEEANIEQVKEEQGKDERERGTR